jgi:hypothetical protein
MLRLCLKCFARLNRGVCGGVPGSWRVRASREGFKALAEVSKDQNDTAVMFALMQLEELQRR